jgi:signal transduction histidine kinase/small basic protein
VTSTPVGKPVHVRSGFAPLSRASLAFLALGAVAIGVYFLLPDDAQDVLYVVIGLAAVAAVLHGARARAEGRLSWQLFAAGLLCAVVADTISGYYEVHLGREPPVPSSADVFYLASYPLLIAGIFLLLRDLGSIRTRAAILDAVIVTVAAGMVQWIFFVGPYLKTSLHPFARGVEMAYPTMDLLMFVALAQLALGTGVRTSAYRLLVVAVGLWIVGDELFGLSVDNYTAGGWLDAFWLGSYVCWGAAGLEPVENWRLALDRRQVPRLTKGRIALLAAALLTVPAVILVERFWHGHDLHPVSIAVGASLLAVLVIARFAGLVRAVDSARIAEREANQRLRELDRLKDEFVSTISHELRTPLTSITGYVELAREQADPETNGYLAVAERNAARLLSLVNDLLFVARLQSGRLDLEEEQVDVAQLVAESVAAAKPEAVGANVELRLRLTGGDTVVRGDRRRLAQVIDNLVSNAIKFSADAGSVDLTVDRGNGKVTIEVEDRGIGISESERERLFERFFRSQGALDRQIPGTGLGLYITKSIVEAHGGSVAARSVVGEGSSFVVELPAAS